MKHCLLTLALLTLLLVACWGPAGNETHAHRRSAPDATTTPAPTSTGVAATVTPQATSTPEATLRYFPPAGTWQRAPLPAEEVDGARLDALVERMAAEGQVRGLLVVRGGYVVFEHYQPGYDPHTPFNIYSCTKSVTSAAVGLAIDRGYIPGVDVRVLDYFPEFVAEGVDERKERLTLHHLLNMTNGLDWPESTTWHHFFAPMVQSPNWIDFVIRREMAEEPGAVFNYSSGGAHLLSYVVQQATGQTAYDFVKAHIFDVIGMNSVSWPSDPQGVSNGGAWIEMSIEDAARFGYLYLNEGRWEDQTILSETWVAASTQAQSEGFVYPDNTGGEYGYQWWLNTYQGYRTFFAWGAREQYIFVIPALDLVAVFSSDYHDAEAIRPPHYVNDYLIPALTHTASTASDEGEVIP